MEEGVHRNELRAAEAKGIKDGHLVHLVVHVEDVVLEHVVVRTVLRENVDAVIEDVGAVGGEADVDRCNH